MKLLSDDKLLGAARTATARTARSRRTRRSLVEGVRAELRDSGAFTAESVSVRAHCSPATFYSHFATKDDALASAFELVLVEMLELVEARVTATRLADDAAATIDDYVTALAGFFRAENLVFRTALSRLSAHPGLRHVYREAERVALQHLRAELTQLGAAPPVVDDVAVGFLVISQGLNNPRAIRPKARPVRLRIAAALVDLLDDAVGGTVR